MDYYAALHGPEDPGFTFHGFKGPKAAADERCRRDSIQELTGSSAAAWVKPFQRRVIRDGRNGRYPSDHYFVSAVVEF